MHREEVNYYSEGDRLSGVLTLPDGREPTGGIVKCPGTLGLKEHERYRRYRKRLTEAGFAVLGFDYRGHGDSEGEALLYPERQVEDFRNSITYLETRDEVPDDRIGIFGLGGLGGGHAVHIAGIDERVKCSVAMTCVADGTEWIRGMRREYEWLDLLDTLAADRKRRVETGTSQLVPARGEDGLHIPTPERARNNREKVENIDPKVPTEFPLRCAEKIMEYRPIDVVEDISPGAIMFVAVEGDSTTPESHAIRMYERARSPKKLLLQRDTTHYRSYDRYFDEVVGEMTDWFDTHLTAVPGEIETREA